MGKKNLSVSEALETTKTEDFTPRSRSILRGATGCAKKGLVKRRRTGAKREVRKNSKFLAMSARAKLNFVGLRIPKIRQGIRWGNK